MKWHECLYFLYVDDGTPVISETDGKKELDIGAMARCIHVKERKK